MKRTPIYSAVLLSLLALASTAPANADPLLFWSSRGGGGNDVIFATQQWLGWGGDIRPMTKRGPNDGGGNGGSPSDPSPTPRK